MPTANNKKIILSQAHLYGINFKPIISNFPNFVPVSLIIDDAANS